MKNLIFILCFFFLTTHIIFSQSGWELIYSFPEDVSAVYFIDTMTGFAGSGISASTKKIMKTSDAGDTWIDVYTSGNYFTKIYFYNHSLGFATGDNGLLLKTTDSGNNWVTIPIGETDEVRAVFFLNDQIGWICVGPDKILRTTDGGNNWENSVTSGAIANMDIEFINESTGYAIGVYTLIFKSSDAGISWNQITAPMAASMFDIEFISEETGFIVGGSQVAKTVDGGDTWDIVNNSGGAQMNSVETFGNKFVWAASSDKVYFSSDTGENWLDQSVSPTSYLKQVTCTDSLHLWLLGDRKLYRTSTGGNTGTGIKDQKINLVDNFFLFQNHPNPFNPSTKIKFTIPTSPLNPSPYQGEGNRERFVTLKIYDVLGKEIAVLVNDEKPAGDYEVEFNANGNYGEVRNLPSGIYFYQLRAGQYVETKKMVLIK